MTQNTLPNIDPSSDTGSSLAAFLNAWRPAVVSSNSGPSRPTYAVGGTFWFNETTKTMYFFDGSGDIRVVSQSELAGYLPLTGGTVQGRIDVRDGLGVIDTPGAILRFSRGATLLGQIDDVGEAAPSANTLMTRQKADARYLVHKEIVPFQTPAPGTAVLEFAVTEEYFRYDLTLVDLLPASNADFGFQVSGDAGATWVTRPDGYGSAYQTSVANYHASGTASHYGGLSLTTVNPLGTLSGMASFYPSQTVGRGLFFNSNMTQLSTGGSFEVFNGGGWAVGTAETKVNRIRVFFNNTNFVSRGGIAVHGVSK